MSETTTTTTTAKKPAKSNWKFAGYWNVLIGGFILFIQGFLGFFWLFGANILSASNFFNFGGVWGAWVGAAITLLLSFLVLLLIWEWLQDLLKVGALVKDPLWLGIIFIVIGLLTFGIGGALVLIGGIFFIISSQK